MPASSPSTSAIDLPVTLEHVDTSKLREAGELAHWHDVLEVVIATQGCLLCQTEQHTFTLNKGDLCFINRQRLHRLVGSSGDGNGTGLILLVSDAIIGNGQFHEAYIRPVMEDPDFSHVRILGHWQHAARIRDDVAAIEVLLRERPRAFELDIVAHSIRIFRLLYCALVEREEQADPVDADVALLKIMIEFIQKHYSDDLRLEDIARTANVGKSTCSRLFKHYTGHSPVSFLINYRLERAAELLRTTADLVSVIARECGFAQQSYFNRMFLRAYGTTPRAWRTVGSPVIQAAKVKPILAS